MMRDHHNTPIELALICSSNGGVLDGLCRIQKSGHAPFRIASVTTDRECGAEIVARGFDLPCTRITGRPIDHWSAEVALCLIQTRPDAVLLLTDRKVGSAIWRDLRIPVWNLHPSLLPHYPGRNALERNFADAHNLGHRGHSLQMGATLHHVDDVIDGGPIIAQRSFTINDASTLRQAGHLCYLLKLSLVIHAARVIGEDDVCTSSLLASSEYLSHLLAPLAEAWAVPWLHNQFIPTKTCGKFGEALT